MFGIGTSRLMGLVREQVIAYYFGRSGSYSAFVAAYKIPNLVRVLLGEGNLSASFIPVLAQEMGTGDEREARRLSQSVLGLLLLTVGVVVLAGIGAAPLLAWVVAPGFDPALRELVERLIRILFPTVALLVTGAWCMGVLHAHGRFFWPNFAPLFWSVVSAGALIAFVGRSALDPVTILAWGVVAGSAVQLAVQLPATRRVLGSLVPAGGWRSPAVVRVRKLFVPMMVGTGVAQLSTLIDIQIATFLDASGVATLAYAQRLYLLPLSLFGVAIAQVALPTLAHESVRSETSAETLRSRFEQSWSSMVFLLLPATAGLVLFGRPIVSLLFERGQFSTADTVAVQAVLAAYAVGLVAYGSVRLLATSFHAVQDTATPVRVATGALVVNAGLGITLALQIGVAGIGLATAFAAGANALALAYLLRRRWGGLLSANALRSVARMVLAVSIAAACATWPYVSMMARWNGWGEAQRAGGVLAFILLFVLVYGAVGRLIGVDESKRWLHR